MTNDDKTPTLIDVAELARRLDVRPGTVYRLVREGFVPVIRVGRLIRFDWDDVRRSMERESA